VSTRTDLAGAADGEEPLELVHVTVQPPTADRLMLLVHGYGSDPHDLLRIVPYVDPDGRFVVVAPRAPEAVPGRSGYRWYTSSETGHDPDRFHASLGALDALFDSACAEHGMERERAVVAGFSQGGSMAYALAFGRPFARRPAGMVAMSTFLVHVRGFAYAWGAPDLPPVLVQHGVDDESEPVSRARKLVGRLRERGVTLVAREYPMAHEVSRASLTDQASWLASVVAGERPSEPTLPPLPPHLDGPVRAVDGDELDDLLATSDVPVIVDFWATWCDDCRVVSPVVEEIARARPDGIVVVALDVEAEPAVAVRHRVARLPAVVAFRNGIEDRRVGGTPTRAELEEGLGLVVTPG
jgi:phospholipase/carboxylesterase